MNWLGICEFWKHCIKRSRSESPNTSLDTFDLDSDHVPLEDGQCYSKDKMTDLQIQFPDAGLNPPSTVSGNPDLTTQQRPKASISTANPTYILHPRIRTGNGQCTHLTMTRLYTKEFRCVLCLRTGSMGWVYRCSQDRELLIEDDMERGNEVDKLCGIFERPTSPRKRSPAARLSSMSFFDEVSDKEAASYSAAQLNQILEQRAHVLHLASQAELGVFQAEPSATSPRLTNTLFPNPDIIPSRTPPKGPKKPWLPLKGGECQFKCCHMCRPTCVDRTYLSLNGIANGDIPFTAITGFGFHLTKKRPVALVKHVRNLGLRPNPPPRPPASQDDLYRVSRPLIPSNTNPSLGLGIFANTETPSLSPPPPPITPYFNIPEYSLAVHLEFQELALRNPLALRIGSRSSSRSKSKAEAEAEARLVPVPEQTQDEVTVTGAPLTPMEELELEDGVFGSAPLEVSGGVAVLEESVGLRVADVVTQF